MSIWSTFKTIKTHDADLHEVRDPDNCGCPGDNEIHLSRSWPGFPVRLSVDTGGEHARAALSRDQARELAQELIAWADDDERRCQ